AGTRREQRTPSRAHQLHVWLHILFVLRFCRLQRLRHCAELPVWRSHAGKFRSSVSRPEYPRLLEPLAHYAFILVPRSRLHAFSARSRARSQVCQQAYRRDPRLFSRFWIDGFVARNRAALHSLWALSGNAPFSFPRVFDQKKARPLARHSSTARDWYFDHVSVCRFWLAHFLRAYRGPAPGPSCVRGGGRRLHRDFWMGLGHACSESGGECRSLGR